MALFNKIDQVQTQKLNISNQIVQSLKILNMSRIELENEVERESESNPLLDVDINRDEIDWENYLRRQINDIKLDKNDTVYMDDSDYDFENMTISHDTLYDRLHAQINILDLTKEMKEICKYLIDSLDEDGYLREDEDIIAEKLGVEKEDVLEAIAKIQELEPAGIGARNLEECLILQLHSLGIYNDDLEYMVKNEINLIANANVKMLASHHGLSQEAIKEYIEIIKGLNPRPISEYDEITAVYAYPDVVIEKSGTGYVAREYNEKDMKLNINPYYMELLVNCEEPEVKKYLKEKLEAARKLIGNVGDRKKTIVNVTNTILEIQSDYFENGGSIKPMTLNDISERIGCHISTVSRAVNDKYMLTPNGLYELKTFFSHGFENEDGNVCSSLSVKDEIRKIIDSEDKKKPYSDKKIEDMLKEKGYDIARRTVAKYREELGYLSSSKRKRI